MNIRDAFTEDVIFMKTMLLACDRERTKINHEIKRYIEFHKTKYKLIGGLKDYFLKKCIWLHFDADLEKCNAAIKRLTIYIAKAEKKINIDDWETQYHHAIEEVEIADVVRHYLYVDGDQLRRRIKCPFHEGNSKHLQIYTKTNSYHCFSCKASGTPVNFVMAFETCDFKEAVDKLQYL